MIIEDWGRLDYKTAWGRQQDLHALRVAEKTEDRLILVEHEPVITVGRKGQRDGGSLGIIDRRYPVYEVERGGEATYHGPGQLVVYPIWKIGKDGNGMGVVDVVNFLERSAIHLLHDLGLQNFARSAQQRPGHRGVWIEQEGVFVRKIASVGISVQRWVSFHGMALNVSTGREPWRAINPCGFESQVMTDLQSEFGGELSFENIKSRYVETVRQFLTARSKHAPLQVPSRESSLGVYSCGNAK